MFEPVSDRVRRLIEQALAALAAEGLFSGEGPAVALDRPKRAEHGDFACNVAMALAKRAGRPPRQIAEALRDRLGDGGGLLRRVEVAGPGFLNLQLSVQVWQQVLGPILTEKADFGRAQAPAGAPRILLEYVSANPTGPLHVGHGRCAAIGDALARLLRFAGHDVARESYVNDAGNQVHMLALSLFARYREARGQAVVFPEQGYHGEYMRELARELAQRDGGKWETLEPTAEALRPLREYAMGRMLEWQKRTLAAFGVEFDRWFSEQSLYQSGAVDACLAELRAAGHLFEQDGAVWFKSIELGGDERDRVVVKASGEKTYIAGDLAYHRDKLTRGFGSLINVLGADHIAHTPGLRAALRAFGHDPAAIEVLLYQMVHLFREGQEVKMSKRSGEFVSLDELIEEVGRDAARYFFLQRRHDSHVDFDIELAKRQSLDNPVFYVQYGHARCAAILRRAAELGCATPGWEPALAARLELPEEIAIVKRLADFPTVVVEAAAAREPHRLILYVHELAQAFQSYYTQLQKVHHDTILPQARQREVEGWHKSWDWERTRARLMWVVAVKQVMANALFILGISAPEQMASAKSETDGQEET